MLIASLGGIGAQHLGKCSSCVACLLLFPQWPLLAGNLLGLQCLNCKYCPYGYVAVCMHVSVESFWWSMNVPDVAADSIAILSKSGLTALHCLEGGAGWIE